MIWRPHFRAPLHGTASADHDARARSKLRDQPQQGVGVQRDAAGGRLKARTRDVDEHRAAAAGTARTRSVVALDNQIVEWGGAPPAVTGLAVQEADRLVVMAIGRIFAPAIGTADAPDRQQRGRARPAIA